MKTYIVLYRDGTMSFWLHHMDKVNFQEGAKLFSVEDDIPISILPEWAHVGFLAHEKIKEEVW